MTGLDGQGRKNPGESSGERLWLSSARRSTRSREALVEPSPRERPCEVRREPPDSLRDRDDLAQLVLFFRQSSAPWPGASQSSPAKSEILPV